MIFELLKIMTCLKFWTCKKLDGITRYRSTGKRKDPMAIMNDVMICCIRCKETRRIEIESRNDTP